MTLQRLFVDIDETGDGSVLAETEIEHWITSKERVLTTKHIPVICPYQDAYCSSYCAVFGAFSNHYTCSHSGHPVKIGRIPR